MFNIDPQTKFVTYNHDKDTEHQGSKVTIKFDQTVQT